MGIHLTLDIKDSNVFIQAHKIQIESTRSFKTSLRQLDFLASVDIKHAYLHIPIFLICHHFLQFTVGSLLNHFLASPPYLAFP